ncbi:MAG: hypothetical protein HGA67_03550 [Candidatus Yonathbacteria bacterium]|nr:hypothetical protein [Candidatus Yonathbacteria bacterium]
MSKKNDVIVPGTFNAPTFAEKKSAEIGVLLREVIRKLNTDPKLKKGVLFHTYTGSMTALLQNHGFDSCIVDIIFLIQETGMARIVKNVKPTIWQICDPDYIDEFLPPGLETDMIVTAITKMKRWRHVVTDNRTLRNKMLKKDAQKGDPCQEVSCSQQLVDETAKTLAALEDALVENEALKIEVEKLKQELTKRPADMTNALAEAIRKIRESK